ncbi:transposable element Tcb2 transposase [Trichonephila clavipes]|nr:transposable element Tcb2 transposase [Trichonephila clavipes]
MGAISWRGLGPLVTLHGKVKAAHYVNILRDQNPFVQTSFPGECPLYQDDNAGIHTAKIVQEWFAEHEGEVGHLDWPQSPDLNIIEHLWGYLESKLRARFPPPSTISALEAALHEEWLHIPLQVVHDLYASIPRRIQSVIQSKGVQLPINKAFSPLSQRQRAGASAQNEWQRGTEANMRKKPKTGEGRGNKRRQSQPGRDVGGAKHETGRNGQNDKRHGRERTEAGAAKEGNKESEQNKISMVHSS